MLADVCAVLEIGNPSQAATRLDEDEKATLDNTEGRPGSGAQEFTIINESGLFSLVLTSRKPEAKAFKKWLTGTVIPSLRTNGGYIVGQEEGLHSMQIPGGSGFTATIHSADSQDEITACRVQILKLLQRSPLMIDEPVS